MFEIGLEGQGHGETEAEVDPPQSALKCFQRGGFSSGRKGQEDNWVGPLQTE